jgi:hypothetical protein
MSDTGALRWIGSEAGSGEYGRDTIAFFPKYYQAVKDRSPLAMLDDATRAKVKTGKDTNPIAALYTAFFGVGANNGANFQIS